MNLAIATLLTMLLAGSSDQSISESSIPVNGDLVISINNLKNTKGQIGILVFNKKEGFPSENAEALREILAPISSSTMDYTFSGLPYGEYAISIMHDENMNQRLDKNFLGIPKEGFGVSNNVVGKMGPPKFEKAVFQFQKNNQSVRIKIRY